MIINYRFLASGNSYTDMSYSWRCGVSTIGAFIPQVCDAIWDHLSPVYVVCPQTEDDWRLVALNFKADTDFPHCCFAIDAKHITMTCPDNAGST